MSSGPGTPSYIVTNQKQSGKENKFPSKDSQKFRLKTARKEFSVTTKVKYALRHTMYSPQRNQSSAIDNANITWLAPQVP